MFRSSFTLAAICAAAYAQEPYSQDASREGRDISFVIGLNAPALTSPETSLNLAVDPAQEPKYANRITPVGQRQQFLIGSELRRRYVDEAKMLSADYIISQVYLQAPFVAKNILSLQAQMMGLYPSSHANDLTEWQQGNAVPPIEGADFSKWQAELGASALPYGLNTFPIQQTGYEADFMLSLSKYNCARYDLWISDKLDEISAGLDAAIGANYADIWSQMQEKQVTGEELCEYLTWAHFNAIPLEGDESRQKEYASLVSETCPTEFYNRRTAAVTSVSQTDSNLVSSAFLSNIRDKIKMAETYNVKGESNATELPLAFTNYQALTSDILLTVATQFLGGVNPTETLPASSSLFIEVDADNTVRGFLNDWELTPQGCSVGDPCTTEKVLASLESKIGFSDLVTTCATISEAADIFVEN